MAAKDDYLIEMLVDLGCVTADQVSAAQADAAGSGVVEVQPRAAGDREDVAVDDCVDAVRRLWETVL